MLNGPLKRRSILQALALTPLAVAIPKMVFAAGAAQPNLDPNDPLAKAMQYTEDASKAGPTRTDKKADCSSCAKFAKCPAGTATCVPGKKTDARAACETFQGKYVNRKGWCMSYSKT